MTSVALTSFLQCLLVVGSALTALKLFSTGLYKQYPIFFLYFLFRVPNSIWPLVFDLRSPTYFYCYVITLPLVLAFYILLVRELYQLVLQDYQGLQTAGRWSMYISLVGSMAIAILTLLPNIQPSMPQRSKIMGFVIASERGIDTALALFIILLLALLSRYPIQLRRNVRVNAVVYSVYFLTGTMNTLAWTILGMRSLGTLNTVITVLNVCSIFAWLILLSPAGEKVTELKSGVKSDNERRLLMQLEDLNAALLRLRADRVG
jgi:purine-cytosine permease-like protein